MRAGWCARVAGASSWSQNDAGSYGAPGPAWLLCIFVCWSVLLLADDCKQWVLRPWGQDPLSRCALMSDPSGKWLVRRLTPQPCPRARACHRTGFPKAGCAKLHTRGQVEEPDGRDVDVAPAHAGGFDARARDVGLQYALSCCLLARRASDTGGSAVTVVCFQAGFCLPVFPKCFPNAVQPGVQSTVPDSCELQALSRPVF